MTPAPPNRRFVLDATYRRFGRVVLAGSPLRLIQATDVGADHLDRIERGVAVPSSALLESLVDAGAVFAVPPPPAAASGSGESTYEGESKYQVFVVTPVWRAGPHGNSEPLSCRKGDHADAHRIVVDDGSEPPIPDATVRLDANRGPAAARNAGLRWALTSLGTASANRYGLSPSETREPIVVFVDDDVETTQRWWEPLLYHFDDQRVGAVAPRVRSRDGSDLLAQYERAHSPLDLGARIARVRPGSRVSYVPSAALICRASAWDEIGGFDENLRIGEDVDFVWRLDSAGWRVVYDPSVSVEHVPRSNWRAWLKQRYRYGTSAAALAQRHGERAAPAPLQPVAAGAWTLALLGHPLVATGAAVATAAAKATTLPTVPFSTMFGMQLAASGAVGPQLAAAVRRGWWPAVALACPLSRIARVWLAVAAVCGLANGWATRGRFANAWARLALGPLRVADDVAYSIGVWRGAFRHRHWAALVPRPRGWPRRGERGR